MQRSCIIIFVFCLFSLANPLLAGAVEAPQPGVGVHGAVDCISCHNQKTDGKSGEELQKAVSENCVHCHTGAGFDFGRSVHADSSRGPNCVTCHGGHDILPVTDTNSPVYQGNMADSCGQCHSTAKKAFKEDFHGKAAALGATNAPDCAYCHNSHDVLNISNPRALVSPKQKTALCGECHQGEALGAQFTEHYKMAAKGPGAPMYWVKKVFMVLILLVVGFFLIHIELDLWHKLRSRKS